MIVNLLLISVNELFYVLSPSQKKSRYENRVGQTFSTLTKFVENMCNIYISK
jgi:hypothetical protein